MLLRVGSRSGGAAVRALLAPACAALPAAAMPASAAASSVAAVAPARAFAAAAKKGATDAVAASSSTGGRHGVVYDEFNLVPPIPKPSAEELAQSCLSEKQLRFARRPMPSSSQRLELLPSVYLGPKPISSHGSSDAGRYYSVDEELLKTIPPTIHRSMAGEYMGGGMYHMIRQPGLDIVQTLATVEAVGARNGGKLPYALNKRVFGLRGASGCGKSATLHYLAQYAREQSRSNPDRPWLLVATRGEEFTRETRGFIAPSLTKPGVFDQALYTMEFFANMLKTEGEALKRIKLKRGAKYDDVQWPEGAKGETLFDLVSLASTDREQAPRLLYDFTAELKRATEVPVLVLLDDYNIWDQPTEFIEPLTYDKMHARRLALVDAFSWFAQKPPVSTQQQAYSRRTKPGTQTIRMPQHP